MRPKMYSNYYSSYYPSLPERAGMRNLGNVPTSGDVYYSFQDLMGGASQNPVVASLFAPIFIFNIVVRYLVEDLGFLLQQLRRADISLGSERGDGYSALGDITNDLVKMIDSALGDVAENPSLTAASPTSLTNTSLSLISPTFSPTFSPVLITTQLVALSLGAILKWVTNG